METPKRKYTKKDGYTISVVYFLRKEKETSLEMIPRPSLKDLNYDMYLQHSEHPIYVRVTFLGKTVSLRSRLSAKMNPEEYDSYIESEEVLKFIKVEEDTIRATVRLLKPEQIPDFKISEWSSYYNKLNMSLYSCVRSVVMVDLKNILTNHPILSSYSDCIRVLTGGLQALPFLASLDLEPAVQLFEKYLPVFKILSIDEANYVDFSYSKPNYSAWDWKTGSLIKLLKAENNPFLAQAAPIIDEIIARVLAIENIV